NADEQTQREHDLRLHVGVRRLCVELHEDVGDGAAARIGRQYTNGNRVRLAIADAHRGNRELARRARHELVLPLRDLRGLTAENLHARTARALQDVELRRERAFFGFAAHGAIRTNDVSERFVIAHDGAIDARDELILRRGTNAREQRRDGYE